MKKLIAILVIFSAIFALTACSGSKSIIGTWTDETGGTLDFFEDGTLIINSGYITTSGTYSFVDKDSIKVQLDGLFGIAGATVYDIEFDKNELRLITQGQTMVLTKVK